MHPERSIPKTDMPAQDCAYDSGTNNSTTEESKGVLEEFLHHSQPFGLTEYPYPSEYGIDLLLANPASPCSPAQHTDVSTPVPQKEDIIPVALLDVNRDTAAASHDGYEREPSDRPCAKAMTPLKKGRRTRTSFKIADKRRALILLGYGDEDIQKNYKTSLPYTHTELADMFNATTSNINDWVLNRSTILNSEQSRTSIFRIRNGHHHSVECALRDEIKGKPHMCSNERQTLILLGLRAKVISITMANILLRKHGEGMSPENKRERTKLLEFKASESWVKSFLRRHGLFQKMKKKRSK